MKNQKTLEIPGIAISPGIAIGKAFVIKKWGMQATNSLLNTESQVAEEIQKFDQAVEAAVRELNALRTVESALRPKNEVELIEAHIEFTADPQLRANIIEKIAANRHPAVDAVQAVIVDSIALFEKMEDEYLRARAADIKDVGNRILKHLTGTQSSLPALTEETILIAEEIDPTDALALNHPVVGLATVRGGNASHAAILARSKGIPLVGECSNLLDLVKTGDLLIADAIDGTILTNPDENTLREYERKRMDFSKERTRLLSLRDKQAQTKDGEIIHLLANIGNDDDMEKALDFGAEGAGLFRTEMLFLHRKDIPTEDEQFEFYTKVILKSRGRPITIRALDVGGDKTWPALGLSKEANPHLGFRGIRLLLQYEDLFLSQLKAILRAGAFGRIRIMLPMITTVAEVRKGKELIERAKLELKKGKGRFDDGPPVGVMIETPAAALACNQLAREVDFFSIGTNDLTQYTLAVDRDNEKVRNLYDPFHPAVLRLIRDVIGQAEANNKDIGLCGEMASDPLAAQVLLGFGLRNFSMSPAAIPVIKEKILNTSIDDAKKICSKVMEMDDSISIVAYLKNHA